MFNRSLGLVFGLAMVGGSLLNSTGHAALATPVEFTCQGRTATIVATNAVTKGTSNADVIYVPDGKQVKVYGNGGDDVICSDNDVAEIFGGAGNDFIAGNGILHGDAGNDELQLDGFIVQRSYAEAYGGAGNDFLWVPQGAYYVDGGSGNDRIVASMAEEVHGGSGNDYIGGTGNRNVYGDAGADSIELNNVDSVDCGAGRDSYELSGTVGQVRRCEIAMNV